MPFTKEGLKSAEHRSRHALGRVPVLEDDEVSIFESGAIIQYILERHKDGGLKPDTNSVEISILSSMVSLLRGNGYASNESSCCSNNLIAT